jgi:hypothetical protein
VKIAGSYASTSDYYWQVETTISSTAVDTYIAAKGDGTAQFNISRRISSSATQSVNFTLYISQPSSTSLRKFIYWQGCSLSHSGDRPGKMNGTGVFNTGSSAITGIQFFMESGNIATGTFSLYGLTS